MMIVFGSYTTAGQPVKERVTTLFLVCTVACTASVVVLLLGDACCCVGRAVRVRYRIWRGVTAVDAGFGREGAGEAQVTVRPQPEGGGRGRWGGAVPQAEGGGLLRAADAEAQVQFQQRDAILARYEAQLRALADPLGGLAQLESDDFERVVAAADAQFEQAGDAALLGAADDEFERQLLLLEADAQALVGLGQPAAVGAVSPERGGGGTLPRLLGDGRALVGAAGGDGPTADGADPEAGGGAPDPLEPAAAAPEEAEGQRWALDVGVE
jgi:hypothetical protein